MTEMQTTEPEQSTEAGGRAEPIVGQRVEIWQDLIPGQWCGGRWITEPTRHTNVGTVTAVVTANGIRQIRVELESGYLIALGHDLYPHKHVWHALSDGFCVLD